MKAISCFVLAVCVAAQALVSGNADATLTKSVPVDTEVACPDNAAVNCSATALVTYQAPFIANDVSDNTGHWHWQVFEAALGTDRKINDIIVSANHRAVPHVPEGFGPVLQVTFLDVVFGTATAPQSDPRPHGSLGHNDTLTAAVENAGANQPMVVSIRLNHAAAPPMRVPEPTTALIFAGALLALMGLMRLKSRKRESSSSRRLRARHRQRWPRLLRSATRR